MRTCANSTPHGRVCAGVCGRDLACALVAAAAFLWLLDVATAAQIYKWVDENGEVQFSDRPPEDASTSSESVELKVSPGAATDTPSEVDRRALQKRLLEVLEREREEKKEAKEKKREEKQALAKQCSAARAQLQELKDSSFFYDTDENGERVIYTDEQREAATRNFEKQIKKRCG